MTTLLAMALAATPSWQTLAGPFAPALQHDISRLTPAKQPTIIAALEHEASSAPGIEGVGNAWKIITDALPDLESPDYSGSGEGFNRTTLRIAGVKVLRGLVSKAAAQLTSKTELDRLIAAIDALADMKPAHRQELVDEAHHAFRG